MAAAIRAFIAIALPTSIKDLLADAQQQLRACKVNAKWVRPANMHLTLKFLGAIDPNAVELVADAAARSVRRSTPFELKVGGAGVFPNLKRPRVLWAGLQGHLPQLNRLQRALQNELAALGFAPEKKAFKAHLTLARFKGAINAGYLKKGLDALQNLVSDPFTVNRLILFQSDLKPTGAVYRELAVVDLPSS